MYIAGFIKVPFYVWKNSSTIGKYIDFVSGTFVIDLNGLKANLTSALSFSDMSS